MKAACGFVIAMLWRVAEITRIQEAFVRKVVDTVNDLDGDKQIKDLRFVGDWVSQHETTRKNMGYSRRYAERMDLAAMTPRVDLSSTGFCLAAPGREYLVYQPGESPFRVQLSGGGQTTFAVEWFDPKTGTAVDGQPVKAAEQATFTPPFSGDAVLYLKAQ